MNDFQAALQITNDPIFYNIQENWISIPLDAILASRIAFADQDIGVYALFHPKYGCIYIGKGASIFNRLKSHYKATCGKERSECWKQFFEAVNSEITAYWFPIKINLANEDANENLRQALERLLQIKYVPLFDRLYKRGNRNRINDLEQALAAAEIKDVSRNTSFDSKHA